MPPPDAEPEAAASQESADLFNYGQIKDYAIFVLRAAQRHKLIVAFVFALVIAASGAYLWALPRTYYVETKLLGQRNQVISSLAVPSRAMPGEADAPARAAGETIKSRASLLALMEQTDLVNHFYRHRSPAGRVKDWILSHFDRAPSDDDKREAILGMLEQRLIVFGSGAWEGTVSIAVMWPDPTMAYQLVNAAQQNFLVARHSTELSNIAEAISILEGHAAMYKKQVFAAAEELEAVRSQRPTRTGRPAPLARVRRRPVVDPEVVRLSSMIEGKQRALKELEDIHRRRLSDLQARLAEQRLTYADSHPIVVESLQNLRAAAVEPPQIGMLRNELFDLKAEYAQRGGPKENVLAVPLPPDIMEIQAAGGEADSGEEYLKRYMLNQAVHKYTGLLERIDSAKIELDTAQAAFKYRYTVLRPAVVPTTPILPKVVPSLVASAIAGLLLALFAALVIDLRSGQILELWQVERKLKLPVLAELPWP